MNMLIETNNKQDLINYIDGDIAIWKSDIKKLEDRLSPELKKLCGAELADLARQRERLERKIGHYQVQGVLDFLDK